MPEPQSSEPRPEGAPQASRLPAWLGRVAPVLGVLAVLLLGMGLGAAWERLIVHELLPVVTGFAVPFLAGVGAVLVPLIVGLFVLRRVWLRRMSSQAFSEGRELAGQELERALSVWVYGKSEPEWEEGRAERLKRLKELLVAGARVGVAGLGLWSSVSLLAVVLGGTVAFASLLASYLQIERLDRQNRLIELQNVLTVQEQESQVLRAQADAAYEQLAGILLDMESTEQAQRFALERIPEAMRLAVPRARPAAGGGAELVVDFPNLERLRGVLRAFMRQDRALHALRRAGGVKPGQPVRSVDWEDLEREVASQGEVSDVLVEVLHRLGPADPARPRDCLWWATAAPRTSELPAPLPAPATDGEGVRWYGLGHMAPEDFRGLQLPFLFASPNVREGRGRVRFPRGVVLNGARLDGAALADVELTRGLLEGASLRGARLEKGTLDEASLVQADLRGASLRGAKLHGAMALGAWLQGADLNRAELWGAYLEEARLEGAELSGAELNGATLVRARLNGARLHSAQLIGAVLALAHLTGAHAEEADLTQAHLLGTLLEGTHLRGVRFHGAHLEGVDLRGAVLSEAQFQAASLPLKSVEVLGFEPTPLEQLRALVRSQDPTRRRQDPARPMTVRLRRDAEGLSEEVAAARLSTREGDLRVGRAELWRVPAFEKPALHWLTGNWHLEASALERLAWAEGEPKALPADFEREVAPVLRRQQTAATEARGANLEGVELTPTLRAALGVRGPPR